MWYPHAFGEHDKDGRDKGTDIYRYHTIVQQTLPTRTGLFDLQSTGVVWLSAVNKSTSIGPPPKVFIKDPSTGIFFSIITLLLHFYTICMRVHIYIYGCEIDAYHYHYHYHCIAYDNSYMGIFGANKF